jgi:hypothetical protein
MRTLTPNRRTVGRRACRLLAALAACIIATSGANVWAQRSSASEYQVKAAFIYHFAKFVEWPVGAPSGPIKIGILGKDPFGSTLDNTVKGKTANGRTLVIKRLTRTEDARSCHIVFVSASEKSRVTEILATIKGAPVLVIGDVERFAHRGGTVNFYPEQNKVRFEVNVDAADKAGLKISSKLLSLARIVKP